MELAKDLLTLNEFDLNNRIKGVYTSNELSKTSQTAMRNFLLGMLIFIFQSGIVQELALDEAYLSASSPISNILLLTAGKNRSVNQVLAFVDEENLDAIQGIKIHPDSYAQLGLSMPENQQVARVVNFRTKKVRLFVKLVVNETVPMKQIFHKIIAEKDIYSPNLKNSSVSMFEKDYFEEVAKLYNKFANALQLDNTTDGKYRFIEGGLMNWKEKYDIEFYYTFRKYKVLKRIDNIHLLGPSTARGVVIIKEHTPIKVKIVDGNGSTGSSMKTYYKLHIQLIRQ